MPQMTTIIVSGQDKPYFVEESYEYITNLLFGLESDARIELVRLSGLTISLRVGAIDVVAETHKS